MSRPRSKLSKILRSADRMERKQKSLKEKNRKPGETDEMMEARMKRDLFGWLDMMEEREVEDRLNAAVEETKEQ